MATSLNVRLSDDMEERLNETLKNIQTTTPLGAEATNSTIVRAALEDFFKKIEEEKKGIVNFSFNLGDFKKEDLEESLELISTMLTSIDLETIKSEKANRTIALIELIKLKIKGDLINKFY